MHLQQLPSSSLTLSCLCVKWLGLVRVPRSRRPRLRCAAMRCASSPPVCLTACLCRTRLACAVLLVRCCSFLPCLLLVACTTARDWLAAHQAPPAPPPPRCRHPPPPLLSVRCAADRRTSHCRCHSPLCSVLSSSPSDAGRRETLQPANQPPSLRNLFARCSNDCEPTGCEGSRGRRRCTRRPATNHPRLKIMAKSTFWRLRRDC